MKHQRGSAFVTTIAVLAALTAALATMMASRRVEFQGLANRMEVRRAKHAAESAIRYAAAKLRVEETQRVDRNGEWFDLAGPGDQEFVIDNQSFRLQIVDENAHLSLNHANQDQLESIGLTPEQVDSVLDWRESNQEARAEGAKDQYYNELPESYNAKLRRFDTVDELLLVKGFSVPQVYEYRNNVSATGGPMAAIEAESLTLYDLLSTDTQAPNLNPEGTARQNLNQGGPQALIQRGIPAQIATQIIARRPQGGYTSFSNALNVPGIDVRAAATILDQFSLGTATTVEGRVNLNTASEAVIAALPGIPSDTASAIVSRQESGIASMTDLASISGMTAAVLRQIGDQAGVGSNTFRIRAMGKAGRSVVCLEGIVRITNGVSRIIRIQEPPEADMTTRWRWEPEAGNTTTLSEVNE